MIKNKNSLMAKLILLLTLIIAASVSLFSQNAPRRAPLNPDFVRFIDKLNSGKAPLPGTDEFGTGAIPPPGMVTFDTYFKNTKLKSTYFDPVYDLRDYGLLTPVKGQTNNACWAFATMGSVESRWLKSGFGTWDLSENNLKYCHGFDPSRNTYGNHWMSTAYFARRSGPLIEADDPNSTSSTCPSGKIPVGYITDARYLPNDMNTIKQAILDEGAIFTLMYYSSTYYNASDFTYYRGDSADVNHAVDLVGWDDTKVTAGGTGAWICKNSYGAGWGEAGFFYVSYNDKCILDYNAYWPVRNEYIAEDFIYGYDKLGNYGAYGYGTDAGYMLVKYIASAPQMLSKVGTYAMAAGENIEIDIFSDFDTITLVPSGLLSHTEGISCPLPGYYTSDLATAVSVKPGDRFYVRVKYNTPGVGYQIPTEYLIPGYSYPEIEKNIAWMSGTGTDGSWFLLGSTNSILEHQMDPCVKVYAEPWNTWTGNLDADWNSPLNWSTGEVPDAFMDIVIADAINDPVINQDSANPATCNHLFIEEGATLTLAAGKALTVNGTLANHAGNTGLVIRSGASLISLGDVTGTATVNSTVSGNTWHLVSAPVSDAVSGTFLGKYLQKHTESTNSYTYIPATDEALVTQKGYALWGVGTFIVTYTGQLNTGLISLPLTRTSEDLYYSGWNLTGNPYPSYIDWDASAGWNKNNVNSTIYKLKDGNWATYISGINNEPGIGTNGGSRYIAPGQGFFISVKDVGNGTLAMDNRVRVHSASRFFKNTDTENLVRLTVSGNGYTDEAIIRFIPEATAEFDGRYDALKLNGYNDESAQVYTLGSTPLAINSLPPGVSEIPLGIHANTSSNYTISATATGSQDKIVLEDTRTGIFTNLSTQPYTFDFVSGENEQRFKLLFNTLVSAETYETESSPAAVYCYHQTVHINFKNEVEGDISIYTLEGQRVATKLRAEGMNSINLPGRGIYIVKVVTEKGAIVRRVWGD
jgi:C1A family cysteine protease